MCGSDNVTLSNGSKKKIKDLGKNDKLIAFDETNKILKNTVIDKIFQGESEEIYKLELEGGNKLKITGGHAIFTKRGWIKVKDLKSTDEVLTIER
ncbi:MAG: Hint domain-containing protein [Candidatus Omnitrophota bacterium]